MSQLGSIRLTIVPCISLLTTIIYSVIAQRKHPYPNPWSIATILESDAEEDRPLNAKILKIHVTNQGTSSITWRCTEENKLGISTTNLDYIDINPLGLLEIGLDRRADGPLVHTISWFVEKERFTGVDEPGSWKISLISVAI